MHAQYQEQMFKAREKRYSVHLRYIKVPTDAAVSYEYNTVRVFRGSVWLYTLPGIRVLQIFNRPERFLTFNGSAEGRDFPGFGTLQSRSPVAGTVMLLLDSDLNIIILSVVSSELITLLAGLTG